MAEAVELAEHERPPLAIGEVPQVRPQMGQALAVLDGLRQPLRAQSGGLAQLGGRPAPAQQRYRLVVGDAEEPRAHLEVAPLALQRRERSSHRALQCVARVLVVSEDRSAVAVQRLVVALVEDRERLRVARGRKRAQHRIAPEPQHRSGGHRGACRDVRHVSRIGNAAGGQKSGAISSTAASRPPRRREGGGVVAARMARPTWRSPATRRRSRSATGRGS
jgi:hypothetical protein